jgi:peptidoglycan-associated lipoprotein
MNLKTPSLLLVLAMALMIGLSGCRKKGQADFGAAVDGDNVFGTPLPDRPAGGVSFFSGNVNRNMYPPIFFAFDSFSISAEEMGKIQNVAGQVRSSRATVIIAGFTDERGTEEYNRALGERRAQAVRDALIGAGANPSLLQTVSFGEEEPADPGSGEAAWARNRRAEFGVVQ